MTTVTNFFCGFRTVARADVIKKLPPPRVPRNYKKADIIAEYLLKATADREVRAAEVPFLASLAEVYLLDEQGKTVLMGPSAPGRNAAQDLLEFLSVAVASTVSTGNRIDLIGFNAELLMAVALTEAFSGACVLSREQVSALRNHVLVYDPIRVAINDLRLADEDLAMLVPEVVLPAVGLVMPPEKFLVPAARAMAALDLASRCRLF